MGFDKARWRRELEMRGRGRNIMSERLSEALRTELREILEAGGKPFDVQVARHLYDFAIAARDLLVVSSKGVEATIKTIADLNGPMESLTQVGDPIPAEQASETFGTRMMREVLAALPMLMKKPDDPKQLVHALAEARAAGMDDVARELEVKLFGHVLSDGPSEEDLEKLTQKYLGQADKVIAASNTIEVAVGSFAHGYADGQAGVSRAYEIREYLEGYATGFKSGPRSENGVAHEISESGEAY
jgi:hypothetical protein